MFRATRWNGEAIGTRRRPPAPPSCAVFLHAWRYSRTDSGIGVGDPAATVMAAHGAEAVTTPHKYQEAPARYITIWRTAPPAADARDIVYEIGGDDRVMHVHAGGPSIEYVEGCL